MQSSQTVSSQIERVKAHTSNCVVETQCFQIRNDSASTSSSTSTKRKLNIDDDEPELTCHVNVIHVYVDTHILMTISQHSYCHG